MHRPSLCTAVTLLAALPAASAGFYPKGSAVLDINAKDYDNLIAKSNYTSIVEFYAPWCGHCQQLQPIYEKTAQKLAGLAKAAAVNCDDEANKPFCGTMGIQGFPTLKIVRPGPKKGRPVVEDYQGQRLAKDMVNAVVEKINNHVQRVSDKDLDKFLSTKNESAKALLFSEKGTTSALLKSLAIDFLDVITVAQIRDSQKKAVDLFGIEKYPTLVLLPGGDKEGIVYDGELKKDAMVKFLSQAGSPNPDPAPKKPKAKAPDPAPKKPKAKAPVPKKDASPKLETDAKSSSEAEEKTTEPLGDETIQKPVILDEPLPIPIINSAEKLVSNCLSPKSHTCVLAFVPKEKRSDQADKALAALAQLAHKHAQGKRRLFPMYEVHTDDKHSKDVLKALDLSGDFQLLAINSRRGWWRLYEAADYGLDSIESWVDQIRLSEGIKRKLPEGVVVETPPPAATDDKVAEEASEVPASSGSGSATIPKAEAILGSNLNDEDAEKTAKSGTDAASGVRSDAEAALKSNAKDKKAVDSTVEEDTAKDTSTQSDHDEL